MARVLFYLVDLIIVLLIARMLHRALRHLLARGGIHFSSQRGAGRSRTASPRTTNGEMARDPVCGMFVSTELSQQLTRGNETLHFCSRECLERYEKQPLGMKAGG